MYGEIRGVASNVHRLVASSTTTGSGDGEFDTTCHPDGAVTLSANSALRSGWSKQAYIRRASATSNWL